MSKYRVQLMRVEKYLYETDVEADSVEEATKAGEKIIESGTLTTDDWGDVEYGDETVEFVTLKENDDEVDRATEGPGDTEGHVRATQGQGDAT